MTEKNRIWRLRKRPVGAIADDDLSFGTEEIPRAAGGQFVFRLNYLSLDPTNRNRMSDLDSYMPPVQLGDPMRGAVCGTVVESKHPQFAAGEIVSGLGIWADYQIGTPETVRKMLPADGVSVPEAFGLSFVGPTAYFGLVDIGIREYPLPATTRRVLSTQYVHALGDRIRRGSARPEAVGIGVRRAFRNRVECKQV